MLYMWVETDTDVNFSLFWKTLKKKKKWESWVSLKFLPYCLFSLTDDLQLIRNNHLSCPSPLWICLVLFILAWMHWGVCSRLFYKQKMWSEFLKSDCLKRRLFLWILIKWRLTGLVWRWEAKTQGHRKAKFVAASIGLLSWLKPFWSHRRWKCWSCPILWHRHTMLFQIISRNVWVTTSSIPSPSCCCPHSKASRMEGLHNPFLYKIICVYLYHIWS